MMPTKTYAYLLVIAVTMWPLFLLLNAVPLWKIILLIIFSIGLLALVWKFCSSAENSFINGLAVISACLTSGCANVTILYLLPFLVIVYLIFVFHTVIGLGSGRQYTRYKWEQFTNRFYAILANRMKK
jgi:hypothetical protein